jgi:hypothetical protein
VFSRHVHETFCILLIENGAQRFYRSGGEHCAPQGHIVLVTLSLVILYLVGSALA